MTTDDVALLRVARVVASTTAEGPGRRFAVWTQGCTIRCGGCFNPHLWTTRGGTLRAAEDLVNEALGADVEGLTMLGGEPFDQAEAAAQVAVRARDAGLSVMVFTGFEYAALKASVSSGVRRLLAATDLLVDGPYRKDFPDTRRPWVGSTNQGFHALTSRYRAIAEELERTPDRVEVRVAADGAVAVNGWADVAALEALLDGVGQRHRRAVDRSIVNGVGQVSKK